MVREAVSAGMERAGSAEQARGMMAGKRYDLVLVNRVFDADGDSGLEFIAAIKASGDTTPMMLVSDYADAQAQAVAKGAMPGFGKSMLGRSELRELLARAAKGPS